MDHDSNSQVMSRGRIFLRAFTFGADPINNLDLVPFKFVRTFS